MNKITYARRRGYLECVKLITDPNAKETKLCFGEKITGTLSLAGTTLALDGKSCIFNTGCLKDGLYYPIAYISSSAVELEGFEIKDGKIRLIPKDDTYVRRLSSEIEALRREITKIKEELQCHDEKINGTPIL